MKWIEFDKLRIRPNKKYKVSSVNTQIMQVLSVRVYVNHSSELRSKFFLFIAYFLLESRTLIRSLSLYLLKKNTYHKAQAHTYARSLAGSLGPAQLKKKEKILFYYINLIELINMQ